MDGQYQNNKIIASLENWLISATENSTAWEGNNMHIDEIETYEKIDRTEWIDSSLFVLSIIESMPKLKPPFIPFLHFDLTESPEVLKYNMFSFEWIKRNISEFTPPSFNITTTEYFLNFYKKELQEAHVDNIISENFNILKNVTLFYRTCLNKNEGLYSRELYFFLNKYI